MTNIYKYIINISKLSPEGEVDSGAHIPRRKASRLRTRLVVWTDPEGDSCFGIYHISLIKIKKFSVNKRRPLVRVFFTNWQCFGDYFYVCTAAAFTTKIASFETVTRQDAILNPIPKQWISKDIPSYGSQSECAKIASYPLIWWILIRVTLLLTFNPANHFSAEREALLGGLHMSPVWISKPVVSRIEEEATSLFVFYYCICTSVAVTVANHLCLVCYHFSCSIITVVTVSRPCCLSKIIPYQGLQRGPWGPY